MTRLAKKVINEKKKKTAAKYRVRRTELKKAIADPKASDEDRFESIMALQRLPKNASPIRVRNRCGITGRARGIMSDFNLSRIKFRELAHRGMIPGIKKASW